MPSPVDAIPVLRIHLEEILEAVDTAYTYHGAHDLMNQARNVGGTNRPSNLTKRLEKALDRVYGYLNPPEEEEDVSQG